MGKQPDGDPAPRDGVLPETAFDAAAEHRMGLYLHVPFCLTRCGYCDFNTYTATELSRDGVNVSVANYASLLAAELELAGRVLAGRTPALSTIFLGGGTPNLLSPADVGFLLRRAADVLGLESTAEVTIEANPESVTPGQLAELRAAGCTRLSLGMQSAVPHVLARLERSHTPQATAAAVAQGRAAGFESISVDLIYGTPGESLADWEQTLDVALGLQVDHISAYALIVESGTRLAAAVRTGRMPAPQDDLMADMYDLADARAQKAGFGWYELSNWCRPGHECRHNLGYWHSDNWWGAGPGAHSHLAGVRWWNHKHPGAWARMVAARESPAAAREQLGAADIELERMMLQSRLATGIELRTEDQQAVGQQLIAEGLAVPVPPLQPGGGGRMVLTRAGRLLADGIVLRLGG